MSNETRQYLLGTWKLVTAVREEVASGTRPSFWARRRLPERDVWLLIRRDLTKVPRVRVLADYLIECSSASGGYWRASCTRPSARHRDFFSHEASSTSSNSGRSA